MREVPEGAARPTVPLTRADADARLIVALQDDRWQQSERARRAEDLADHLRSCLAAVGAGADLADALRSSEADVERLRRQVGELRDALTACVSTCGGEAHRNGRARYALDNTAINDAITLLRRHGVDVLPYEIKKPS